MLYVRAPAIAKRIDEQNALFTRLESHVGLLQYEFQVGMLAVPEVVQVDAVNHYVLPGGEEMLTRAHNIYTFTPA